MTPEEGRIHLEINHALLKLAHKHGALAVAKVARSYADYVEGQQAIMARYDMTIEAVEAECQEFGCHEPHTEEVSDG